MEQGAVSMAGAEPGPGAARAAVIIPHYNDVARLTLCLERLTPQAAKVNAAPRVETPPPAPRVEIVVADNGSSADLGPVRAAFPAVRFVAEIEKGAAPARNRGVAETDAHWLFFLDADCVPAADWLERALALAGSADIVGGRVDTFDETPRPKSGAEAYETVWAFQQRHYVESRGFSVTANLLTSRAVFADVGGFLNGVPEDIEWCRRATGKGYRLAYADDLAVAHPTRSDWPALRRKMQRLTRERRQMFGAGRRLAWALRAFLVPGYALLQAPRAITHPGLSAGERLAALGTLVRVTALRMGLMLRQTAGTEPP